MHTILEEKENRWFVAMEEEMATPVLAVETKGGIKYAEDPIAPEEESLKSIAKRGNGVSLLVCPPCSTKTLDALFSTAPMLKKIIVADADALRLASWQKAHKNIHKNIEILPLPSNYSKAEKLLRFHLAQFDADLALGKGAIYLPGRFKRLAPNFSRFLENTVLRYQQEACAAAAFKTTRSWHVTMNLLMNIKLKKCNTIEQPQKQKIIVVGAGPSLDENVATLAEFQENVIIVATDASVNTLLDNGVIPDLAVSLDDSDLCWRFFANRAEELKKIPLVTPLEGSNAVAKHYPGEIIFTTDSESPSWLKLFSNSLPKVKRGQCVGHFAFHIAEYMEAEQIIMTGFDLAFCGENFHTKGSAVPYHEDLKESFEYLEVDGVDGKPVKTDLSMSFYLKYFEDAIDSSACEVIDATEGGALIRGTQLMTLKETLCNLKRKKPITIRENTKFNTTEHKSFFKKLMKKLSNLELSLKSAKTKALAMTSSAVLNPLISLPLHSDEFRIVGSCGNTLLMTAFAEIASTYKLTDFSEYRRLLLEIIEDLLQSRTFVESLISLSEQPTMMPDSALFILPQELKDKTKHLIDTIAGAFSKTSFISHDAPLPEIWNKIELEQSGKVVCINGSIIPDVWLMPAIKCIDLKDSFEPHSYERSLWMPGYKIVCSDTDLLSKWQKLVSSDITCELWKG